MIDGSKPISYYTQFLLFLFLLFAGLYYASSILIPVSFGALLAMLMTPVANKFESWGLPKGLSAFFCIVIVVVVFLGLLFILSTQIISFTDDLPQLKQSLATKLNEVQIFVQRHTDISPEKQIEYMKTKSGDFVNTAVSQFRNIALATTGTIATMGLVVIYTFFFIFYRKNFRQFILKITNERSQAKTSAMLSQIGKVTQKYLTGMIIVISILAVLNSTGLLIIGIKHAVFFGVLAAILNLIPYIGTFIGGTLPTIMALLTKDSITPAIAVVATFAFIQFLENNFLTPNIVGSQVRIKPVFTIIILLIGGMVWGVAGMIMFIPFLGILKVVFDNVENLKPYGYLIGDQEDENKEPKPIIKHIRMRMKKAVKKEDKGN